MSAMPSLTASLLADLAGVSRQMASKVLKDAEFGKPWRNTKLTVEWTCQNGGQQRVVTVSSLPAELQAKWAKENLFTAPAGEVVRSSSVTSHTQTPAVPGPPVSTKPDLSDITAGWQKKTAAQKQKGADRAKALFAVETVEADGLSRSKAVKAVASTEGVSEATIWGWLKKVDGYPRDAWHMVLTGRCAGRQKSVEISDDAWEYILTDYLRNEAPALTAVYDRAKERFELPPYKTVLRRVNDLSPQVTVLAREGVEALERIYPHQERDREWFGALEAVNADGHKFDVFVKWPDGEISRPMMAAWQDIYSGKILAYEITKTENTDTIRTAFGRMVSEYGIPEHAYLDNGRGFASKWLTGGAPTRYRFKVKEDEPMGILTQMGVKTHWCTPYHGQAKPIERAFRDLACERIAKHPACAGAYTGNTPMAKPENYGSRAVPIAQFKALVSEQVEKHNAREGRRSKVCAGRSFDQVFEESMAARISEVRRPEETSLAYLLMPADTATIRSNGSYIAYAGNRYFNEKLIEQSKLNRKVAIRFDPQRMHSGIFVYSLDGRFVCKAGCVAATGFGDTEAAREHNRAKSQFKRAAKEQLKAVTKMSALEAVIPNITTDDEGTTVVRIDGKPDLSKAGRDACDTEFPAETRQRKATPAQRDEEFDQLVAVGMRRAASVQSSERERSPAELFNQ